MTTVNSTSATQGVSGLQTKSAGDAAATQLIKSVRAPRNEPEGPHHYNEYTKHVAGNPNLPWCAAFVSTMLEKQNIPGVSGKMFSASCAQLASQFRAAGKYSPAGAKPPQPGDVIFFGSPEHHTGIVESVKDGKVYTVEGNSSDKVSERSYDLNDPRISGYGKVIAQPVSGDLGFDTSKASSRGGGSAPSGRAQGRGSAHRATDTGLDAASYTSFSWLLLLRMIEAIMNGDTEAIEAALAEAYPYVSKEDLAALAKTLQENPELANLVASNPQGTLDALLTDSSPKAIKAMLQAPRPAPTEPPSEDTRRLFDGLMNSSQLKNRTAALSTMMPFIRQVENAPRPPRPPAWQPPSAY